MFPPWRFCRNIQTCHALFFRRRGLHWLYVDAAGSNFWIVPWVIYTPRRSVRVMQQAFFFCTICFFTWRDCIFCLVLASSDLPGFGRWGGLSSLSFPGITVMVGICPSFFQKFIVLRTPVQRFQFAWTWRRFPCRSPIKSPILKDRIVLPICWVPHKVVFYLFIFGHILGGVRSREER